MKLKEGSLKIDAKANTQLDKLSILRRESGSLAWRKRDIVAELVGREFNRRLK